MADGPNQHPSTTRLEAFSDGVIAIIITIMVLELKVPAEAFDHADFGAVLQELGPDLLIYGLSFLVIAVMTINHHSLFRIPPHSTNTLFWWNAYLLFWMSLIPISTAVFARHPLQPLSVAFYGANIFCASLGFQRLRHYVSTMENCTMPTHLKAMHYKNVVSTLLWAASVPLAFVSPWLSIAIFVFVSASYFVPDFNPLSWGKPKPALTQQKSGAS